MIIILLSSLTGCLLTVWSVPYKKLWPTAISLSSFLFLASLSLLSNNSSWGWSNCNSGLAIDYISLPLIVLSTWLIPVCLLASVSPLYQSSCQDIRLFISLLFFILFALIITFSSLDLFVFFIGFESTLVPTLFIITRWGTSSTRIEAGLYFVFYTLASSLPFLLSLILLYLAENTLSLALGPCLYNKGILLPIFCILGFLVKVPIFGFHLWLPKAHVEAPVAGSMILAAILLKLGGYGFLRLYIFLWEILHSQVGPFLILFCSWGALLSSLICLSQTDLKSLIAYSSVSHMSMMIASLSVGSSWSVSGGLLIMISHGLTSSALFSSANILYERSGTRTLYLNRGYKGFFSLFPSCWFLFLLSNLGFPPFPNSLGELFSLIALFSWSLVCFWVLSLTLILTSIFSLSIFLLTCSGWSFKWNSTCSPLTEREFLLLLLHLFPLLLLIPIFSFF
uniref:NADH-ubiquinone oxidoreductase chain 4 n=1 Tax=Aspidophiura sp. TaxID=3135528 RepID=A0AAU6QD77_9ECHI